MKNICIIGGTGRLGGFFKDIFEKDDIKVSNISRKNYDELKEKVEEAEIIIISIPIHAIEKIINDLKGLVKKDQLVIDFSSVMSVGKEGLKELKCGSAFVHPLFAPTIENLHGARFIVVPINKNKKLDWFLDYLKNKKAYVKEASLELHEKLMAYIQAISHFNGILLAKTIADSDLSPEDIEEFTTVFFRLEFDAISRIFSQSSEMYANIQFHNEKFVDLIEDYEDNLKGLKKIVKDKDYKAYEKVFKKIIGKLEGSLSDSYEESKEIVSSLSRSRKKIGVLGPAGSFTELATNGFDDQTRKVFFDSVGGVIKAVKDGLIDYGVVPIENSVGGTVAETVDGIYMNHLRIEKMIVVPIRHCCAALSDSVKPDIILSHPQAFIQCSEFIEKNFPDAKKIETLSTSEAFKKIADDYLVNAVAIGPNIAADKYNLKIIKKDIQNRENNKTKFAVISKNKDKSKEGEITSIVVMPKKDRAGLLFDILKHFKDEDINLTKLESRPAKDKLGTYVFHIDLEGNAKDKDVKRALSNIKKFNDVTFLGSYDIIGVEDDKKN